MTNKQIKKLSTDLWEHYDQYGRSDLLWRKKITPYKVVVSEIMLQQTQVTRVTEYFDRWMSDFPDWQTLADASLADVLNHWQGLGYNRRGKYVHDIAKQVVRQHGGRLPTDETGLRSLPGIGPYTAGAVTAFAYNKHALFLETNIRTVLIYYSKEVGVVADKELLAVLQQVVESDVRAQKKPREFYWALMDYGSHLKKTVGNLNKQSKTYTKQSRFEGSRRQLRSGILKYILQNSPVTKQKIIKQSGREQSLVEELLGELKQEQIISKKGKSYGV